MVIKRIANTKKSFIWGVLERIMGLFFPFLLRSILIKTLGENILGLNGLFSSILQILNLTELGVSSAITYNMFKPIAENDLTMISALLNLYKKVYRVIGIVFFTVGMGVMPFLKYFISDNSVISYNIYFLYLIYFQNLKGLITKL